MLGKVLQSFYNILYGILFYDFKYQRSYINNANTKSSAPPEAIKA